MQNNSFLRLLLFPLVGLLLSCGKPTLYSDYHSVSPFGWEADSSLSYRFAVTDTLTPCDLIISVRHTQNYPFQNMWLFLEWDSDSLSSASHPIFLPQRDTIEFYLADQRGRWLGNGFGQLREMPVLYAQSIIFPHAGNYLFRIRHGMRDNSLRGISDVGLQIEPHRP